MHILHLSDLHFHRDQAKNTRALQILRAVETQYPSHYVVITGDISDDGDRGQLDNALEALRPLAGRLSIIPGNHDGGPAGNFYMARCVRDFDEILCARLGSSARFYDKLPATHTTVVGGIKILFIGLNSNLPTTQPFDFACGEVGDSQIAALDGILTAPSSVGFTKIVYLHHHPFVCNDPFMQLVDAQKFMRALYQRADVLLFGHRHVSGVWSNRGGIRLISASDSTPESMKAREIEISEAGIFARDVLLES